MPTLKKWQQNTETWLNSLADKSLLQHQPDGRYALHPLLRQFAAEKQAEYTGVLDTAPQRHAEYYLEFLRNKGRGENLIERAEIRANLPNIRTAWIWAAIHHNLALIEQTAEALHNFYSLQSWFQEGIDAFQLAIEQIPEQENPTPEWASALCELLGRKGRMHISIGQLDIARIELEKASVYLQRVQNPDRRSVTLGYLAISNFYAGSYPKAIELAEESLHLSQQTNNLDGIAFAANFLGSCFKVQGDYQQAREHFEQAVNAYQENQDGIGAAMVLNNLGNIAQILDDFEAAQQYYETCISLFKTHDHIHGAATTLANAGKLALKQSNLPAARALLEESLTLKRQMNDLRGIAVALSGLGVLSLAEGDTIHAWDQFKEALEITHSVGDVQLSLNILVGLGELAEKLEETGLACAILSFASEHPATAEEARHHTQLSEIDGQKGRVKRVER